jgi:hypothetical protein
MQFINANNTVYYDTNVIDDIEISIYLDQAKIFRQKEKSQVTREIPENSSFNRGTFLHLKSAFPSIKLNLSFISRNKVKVKEFLSGKEFPISRSPIIAKLYSEFLATRDRPNPQFNNFNDYMQDQKRKEIMRYRI